MIIACAEANRDYFNFELVRINSIALETIESPLMEAAPPRSDILNFEGGALFYFFVLFFFKMAFILPYGQWFLQQDRITGYIVTKLFVLSWFFYRIYRFSNIMFDQCRRRIFMEFAVGATGGWSIWLLQIHRLDIDVSQTSLVESWP